MNPKPLFYNKNTYLKTCTKLTKSKMVKINFRVKFTFQTPIIFTCFEGSLLENISLD